MSNLFAEFRALIPVAPLYAGAVTAVVDGVATVELPDGAILRARGAATLGQTVWVRDGLIEGVAPALPFVEIEV